MAQGHITHMDIPSDDIARAKAFYAGLFGWQIAGVDGFPDYEMFSTGQERVGGGIGLRGKTAPNAMRIYVTVDSIEDTIAKVAGLGGSVAVEKTEVPGMGAYAALTDTEGNEIGVWETAAG